MKKLSRIGLVLAVLGIVTVLGASVASAQAVLEVKSNKVCIGCEGAVPVAPFEVRKTDGTAKVIVRDTGAAGPKSMFELINSNGDQTIFRLNDGVAGVWDFKVTNGGFQLNEVGDPVEMTVAPSGAVFALSFTPTSTKTAKHNFEMVDSQAVLNKIVDMPIQEWSYNESRDRHIGPFAEDFAAAFGLDGGNTGGINLTDLGGVSLVAIQGLSEVIEQKDKEIAGLEERLHALEATVSSLSSR